MLNHEGKTEEESFLTTGHTDSTGENNAHPHCLTDFANVAKFITPYMLSRAAVAALWIGNGLVIAELGGSNLAAGPLISALPYAIIGAGRSMITANVIRIGKLNGEHRYAETGPATLQAWMYALMLSIPTMAIMLSIGAALRAAGTADNVAQHTQTYFNYLTPSIPFVYCLAADERFALGIKRKKIPLASGLATTFGQMLIGYPLALRSNLKLNGLAIGVSLSHLIAFIGLRLYYLSPQFEKYHLFQKPDLRHFWEKCCDYFSFAFFFGVQTFCEWGNLAIITVILSSMSSALLEAEQVSITILNLAYITLFSSGAASASLVSNALGENKPQKAYRDGNMSILFGLCISLPFLTTMLSIPHILTKAFTGKDNEGLLTQSQEFLLVNAMGLPAEAVRIMASGDLNGHKDVRYQTAVSFLFMTIIGIGTGAGLVKGADFDPSWLFITRNIGSLSAARLIMKRWKQQSAERMSATLFSPPTETDETAIEITHFTTPNRPNG